MPDEEFDVLGEDELALLTRRNRVNMRRNTRTCLQCGKPGHFVVDCLEKVENKDGYKHKPRNDGKYQSRRDYKSKYKNKHKDVRRSRNKETEARPERWLVRATSTPVPCTPPRARVAVKAKVIVARARRRPRT
jgi:hypothetical protein